MEPEDMEPESKKFWNSVCGLPELKRDKDFAYA
jgi:hypothetical protein